MTTQWRQLHLSKAKLKAVSRTSALIVGFAMVAMVEVQLDREVHYEPALLIMFSAVTACLVAVHLFALMIATCMLPNMEAACSMHTSKFIAQSPHHHMRNYIELAWILSTGIGLVLFLIEIALLIWLKFHTLDCHLCGSTASPEGTPMIAAWVATGVLVPVVVVLAAFAFHFYTTLAQSRYNMFRDGITELDAMAETGNLDHQRSNINLAGSLMQSSTSLYSKPPTEFADT